MYLLFTRNVKVAANDHKINPEIVFPGVILKSNFI